MVEFQNVAKSYKNQTVLDSISFKIRNGEIVVLVGPSGCGKTTTLKMINRLIEPSGGTILIDGKNIETLDPIKLRRNIGYVIQQTGLFSHMTVRQNIEVVPRLEKMDGKKIAEKTIQLLKMVGLEPEAFIDRYPTQLSGGQLQRVGVARAFSMDPAIILMDEPFSALDPITRTQLQDELVNLHSHMKKTIVFVTHDMDEAVKIADRICIMHDGKILQYDTPEQVLKNPVHGFVSEFVGKNRIWSSPELIKARDIMLTEPQTILMEVTMIKAMEKMRMAKVNTLLVTDEEEHLIGFVDARKIIKMRDDLTRPVSDIVTEIKVCASPDDNIVELLRKVNQYHVPTIPVVDEGGVLLGLITNASLVTTMSQQFIDFEEGSL